MTENESLDAFKEDAMSHPICSSCPEGAPPVYLTNGKPNSVGLLAFIIKEIKPYITDSVVAGFTPEEIALSLAFDLIKSVDNHTGICSTPDMEAIINRYIEHMKKVG